jgi:hypothetical protein
MGFLAVLFAGIVCDTPRSVLEAAHDPISEEISKNHVGQVARGIFGRQITLPPFVRRSRFRLVIRLPPYTRAGPCASISRRPGQNQAPADPVPHSKDKNPKSVSPTPRTAGPNPPFLLSLSLIRCVLSHLHQQGISLPVGPPSIWLA